MNGNGIIMYESDSLAHYGVLGMKWGVRKQRPTRSPEEKAARRRKWAKRAGIAAGLAGAGAAGYMAYKHRGAIKRGANGLRTRITGTADRVGRTPMKQRYANAKRRHEDQMMYNALFRGQERVPIRERPKYQKMASKVRSEVDMRRHARGQKKYENIFGVKGDMKRYKQGVRTQKRVNRKAGGSVPDYLNTQYPPKLGAPKRRRRR